MNGRKIPKQRQKVLDFCRAEIAAGRKFPRPLAIANHMGWENITSARDALKNLDHVDGALEHTPNGYRIKPQHNFVSSADHPLSSICDKCGADEANVLDGLISRVCPETPTYPKDIFQ